MAHHTLARVRACRSTSCTGRAGRAVDSPMRNSSEPPVVDAADVAVVAAAADCVPAVTAARSDQTKMALPVALPPESMPVTVRVRPVAVMLRALRVVLAVNAPAE